MVIIGHAVKLQCDVMKAHALEPLQVGCNLTQDRVLARGKTVRLTSFQTVKQPARISLFPSLRSKQIKMSTTEDIAANETSKEIENKTETMATVPLGAAKEFDNEAEAIAVTTDHAGEPQRWGKGIIRDFKRTVGTNWIKEMTNFNQKTIAVTVSEAILPNGNHFHDVRHANSPSSIFLSLQLFIYIAAISPTVTFGAVYGRSTNNYMGAIELMLATGWYGMFYAIIGGMPMCINGGTGPVLTFQTVCFQLATNLGVPFLTFNAWVGIWVGVYLIVAAFIDLNRVLKYATRFTDEVFAFLIISIFLLDAIGDPISGVGMLSYFNPESKFNKAQLELDPTYSYLEVALLSLVLGCGTAFFAIALRSFRTSPFFCNDTVRTSICDFSITISVVVFTCIAQFAFSEVPLEELNVPPAFEPTFTCCTSDCTTYWPDQCQDQAEVRTSSDPDI
jgi:hypothetical protein